MAPRSRRPAAGSWAVASPQEWQPPLAAAPGPCREFRGQGAGRGRCRCEPACSRPSQVSRSRAEAAPLQPPSNPCRALTGGHRNRAPWPPHTPVGCPGARASRPRRPPPAARASRARRPQPSAAAASLREPVCGWVEQVGGTSCSRQRAPASTLPSGCHPAWWATLHPPEYAVSSDCSAEKASVVYTQSADDLRLSATPGSMPADICGAAQGAGGGRVGGGTARRAGCMPGLLSSNPGASPRR